MKKIDYSFADLHSHIMFNVDDGAGNKSITADMLTIAKSENIGTIVVTPHYHPVKCQLKYGELIGRFNEFVSFAREIGYDGEFVLGREVFFTSDILDALERGEKLTIGDTKYILLEFDVCVNYKYLYNAINDVMQYGYIPIIAHVERYQCLLQDIKRVEELSELGAVIQVNCAGVLGDEGTDIKKFIKKLMKNRIVNVVATDAHSAGRRAPRMLQCAEYVTKKYGYDYARDVFEKNILLIIEGKYLED